MAEEEEPIVATRLESPGAVEDMSSSSARTVVGTSVVSKPTSSVSSSARTTSTAAVPSSKSSVAPPVATSSSSSSAILRTSSTLSSVTSSSSSSRASSASSAKPPTSISSSTLSSTSSSTSSTASSNSAPPKVVTVTTSVSSSVSRSSSASASISSSALVGGNEGSASKGGSGLSTGAIVGIAIGGVAVLCIIALLATRSFRKRARARRTANRTSIMDWNPPVHHEEKDETPYTPPLQSYAMQPPFSQDIGYEPQPPLANTFQQQQYQPVYYPEPAYTAQYPIAMPVAPVPPPAPVTPHGLTDGTMVRVKQAFVRSLDDELAITPDQQLLMHTAYDDGWCLCEDGSNNKGMVPLSCLEPWVEPTQQQSGMIRSNTDTSLSSRSQRRSSLHADKHAAELHANAQQ